jgi:hypothetical protein
LAFSFQLAARRRKYRLSVSNRLSFKAKRICKANEGKESPDADGLTSKDRAEIDL